MMTLDQFFRQPSRPLTPGVMSQQLGVSQARLSQIRSGSKCSVKVALQIEAMTQGAVNAATLSDDVALLRATAAVQSFAPDEPFPGSKAFERAAEAMARIEHKEMMLAASLLQSPAPVKPSPGGA